MNPPPYPTFPIVADDRILLREIRSSDLNDLIEISYYDGIQASSVEQAAAMQSKINGDYLDGSSIHWGIEDRLTGKIVGTCGYYRGFEQGKGELGCVLLPQYRGKGYMSTAMSLAITFGLNDMELNRIWAATTKTNKKAIRLLEGLGFIKIADLDDHEIEFELQLI